MVSFSIDRGGTFTDVYAIYNNQIFIEKLLSVDPSNYPDAPMEGIRRILERVLNKPIIYGKIDPKYIKQVRMGTTVVDSYLTPHIQAYIASFQKGFSTPIESNKLLFMQSGMERFKRG